MQQPGEMCRYTLPVPFCLPLTSAILVVFFFLGNPCALFAQDCFDYATAGLPLATNIPTDDLVQDVMISENTLVLIERQYGIRLFGIEDPDTPLPLGQTGVGTNLSDGALAGNTVILTDQNYGLYCVDISQPMYPTVSDSVSFENGMIWIEANGALGACADRERNLVLLNLQDAAHPWEISRISLPAPATGIAFVSQYIFVTCGNSGLQIIDASNPAQPVLVNSYTVFGFSIDLAIDGNVAYVLGDGFGVMALDISDPSQPSALSAVRLFGLHWGLDYSEGRVFVAAGINGLDIIDASDPANLAYMATVSQSGHCFELVTTKTHTFVACSNYGVDISNFTEASFPGFQESGISFIPMDIATDDGRFMYMAAGENGLQVVDLNDPSGPKIVATLPTPGHALKVAIDDSILVAHDDMVDILVVDIADPLAPVIIGVGVGPDESAGITIDGNLALSLHPGEGISCYDMSIPGQTRLASTTYVPDDPSSVLLLGQYGLVTLRGAFSGLQVIDFADPDQPVTIDWLYVPGGLTHLVAADGYLLAIGDDSALHIIDFTDPGNLALATSLPLQERPASLTTHLQHVYLQNKSSGMVVLDITDPGAPLFVGNAFLPMLPNSVHFGGGVILSNCWDRGVILMPLQCPNDGGITHVPETVPDFKTDMIAAYPNPFNPRTTVVFTLQDPGPAVLEIVDLKGQLVCTLTAETWLPAGEHQSIWEGTDKNGRAVSSGIYFARLRGSRLSFSSKLTLIR